MDVSTTTRQRIGKWICPFHRRTSTGLKSFFGIFFTTSNIWLTGLVGYTYLRFLNQIISANHGNIVYVKPHPIKMLMDYGLYSDWLDYMPIWFPICTGLPKPTKKKSARVYNVVLLESPSGTVTYFRQKFAILIKYYTIGRLWLLLYWHSTW